MNTPPPAPPTKRFPFPAPITTTTTITPLSPLTPTPALLSLPSSPSASSSTTSSTPTNFTSNPNININNWLILASPTTGSRYCCAKPKGETFHGIGLSVSLERSKALSKSGKQCAYLLEECANFREAYAKKVLKSLDGFESLVVSFTDDDVAPPTCLSSMAIQSLKSFAKQTQFHSISVKSNVVRPLSSQSTFYNDSFANITESYFTSRSACIKTRNSAVFKRAKYVRGVKEGGTLIKEVLKVRNEVLLKRSKNERDLEPSPSSSELSNDRNTTTTTPDDILNPPPAWDPLRLLTSEAVLSRKSEQLRNLLLNVIRWEDGYRTGVEEDNKAIADCVTSESECLLKLEELEIERLSSFSETLLRLVKSEKGALDNARKSLSKYNEVDSDPTITVLRRKSNYQSSPPTISSTSSPDPLETLRADLLFAVKRSQNTSTYTSSLKKVIETLLHANETFAQNVTFALSSNGYPSNSNSNGSQTTDSTALCTGISKCEGKRGFNCWSLVVSLVMSEVQKLSIVCEALKELGLAVFGANDSEKVIKNCKESNDLNYKMFNDYKSKHNKLTVKLQTLEIEATKSVEKVNASRLEFEHGPKRDDEQFSGLRRTLGGILSSLGNDDVLNKVTSAKERLEIAEDANSKVIISLNEARLAVDAARKMCDAMSTTFTLQTTESIKALQLDEAKKEQIIQTVLKKLIEIHSSFINSRQSAASTAEEGLVNIEENDGGVRLDSIEWARKVEKKIRRKDKSDEVKTDGNDNNNNESEEITKDDNDAYSLSVKLETQSVYVYKLLHDALGYNSDSENLDVVKSIAINASSDPNISDNDIDAISGLLREVENASKLALEASTLPPVKSKEQEVFDVYFGDEMNMDAENNTTTDANSNNSENNSSEAINDKSSTVIESFFCAHWPEEKESLISPPLLQGRIFVTTKGVYFLGWGKFKLAIELEEIAKIHKESVLAGLANNALRIITRDNKSYYFGSFPFRENCFQLLIRLTSVKGALIEAGMVEPTPRKPSAATITAAAAAANAIANVDPKNYDAPAAGIEDDEHLRKKMEVVMKGQFSDFSVKEFYELFWHQDFYKPWLLEKGNKDVKVSEWVYGSFLHAPSKETFEMRRTCTFDYPRTTHLWVGPPMAGVTQTQFCRVSKDVCVIGMIVSMNGIPYADVFTVDVRWVATNVGGGNVRVEVGVMINFLKSSMFKGQIKSGTLEETGNNHKALFKSMEESRAKVGLGGSSVLTSSLTSGVVGGEEEKKDIEVVQEKVLAEVRFERDTSNFNQRYYVILVILGLLVMILTLWNDVRQSKLVMMDMRDRLIGIEEDLGRLVNVGIGVKVRG